MFMKYEVIKMEAPMKDENVRPNRKKRVLKMLDMIIPITGAISYELFSTKIMVAKQFSSVLGNKDAVAADILWMNAHIGFGIYLYRHKLFQQLSTTWRITYSAFGATMFNFGSALFWGTIRALFPETPDGLRFLVGLGSGMLLMYIGWKFVQDIDKIGFKKYAKNESIVCISDS